MTQRTTNTESHTGRIRLLVVDDNELFREGLVSLLQRRQEIEVVGQAEDGYQALQVARELHPQLILMDVDMPNCNGVRATELIKRELSDINIIMLTVSEEDKDLFTAIKAGAKGYLIKDVKIDELLKAIIVVSRGEAVISPSMAAKLLDEFSQNHLPPTKSFAAEKSEKQSLSEREQEVLKLVAVGATNREIADKLVISENTVKVHLHNIMEKLHLRNRQHAAAYAIREGLITEIPAKKEDILN
jgi:two-component system NarL family response regulator